MARKKRRKHTTAMPKDNRKAVPIQPRYQELPSPFEGMSDVEVVAQLREMGESYKRQFEEAVQSLQAQLITIDPLRLLAAFSYYGLTMSPGRDPELTQDHPILQPHVELLQAFVLQHELGAFELHPVVPPTFEAIREHVQTASQAFARRRFSGLDVAMSPEERRRLAAIESIRGDTQVIRNWGYPQQIIRIVKELFAPLEESIERTMGIRIADVIDMLLTIGQVLEDRVNAHRNLLIPVARARTVRAAAEAYFRAFPDLASTPDEFVREMQQQRVSLDQVKGMLISHSDLRLDTIYTLDLDDFVRAYLRPVAAEQVRAVLERWSYAFGDLHDHNPEFFFMGNPIWVQPLIRLDSERFFWPIPSIVTSFCMELAEALIRPHGDIFARYEARRGKFLEDDLARLFERAFPGASLFQGSQWHDPATNRDYENDLLVLLDTHLIVVEAKAGRVSEPARRGAEGRLRRTIEDLIIAPATQAQRFADYLLEYSGVHRFPTRDGHRNEIDTSGVRHVIRLSITLEPIGILQTRLPHLRAAGLIPNDVALAPTILLTDLELVFELLDGACEKLHYLTRRAQFEEHADYLGDEPDLLAFYLDTGFNIGEAEFDGTALLLYGMSKTLDPYFMQEWHREHAQKPHRQLTQWWRDMLRTIEARAFPRWTELGVMLLNVGYDDQVAFERVFQRAQRLVRRWTEPGHEESAGLSTGSAQRRDAFVGVAYKRLAREQRQALLSEAGTYAIEQAGSSQAVVIGIDIDRSDYPYSVIACIYKDDEVRHLL